MSKSKRPSPTADDIRNFFAWSDLLDREVLKPLEHIKSSWQMDWDTESKRYVPEEDSFAADLNLMIEDIAITAPSERYHDNEDILAEYVIEHLKWPIRKERGRWVGEDYPAILEQGAFDDIDQAELLTAATGRIYAAFEFGQKHYDEMEESHRRMLAAILSIILYHRAD
jgi:hypothetical protein